MRSQKLIGFNMLGIRFVASLITLLVMSLSCSSVQTKPKGGLGQSSIDAKTLEISKGSKDIKLLRHQLRPIDYLLKNPDIKGLLVNHYMGTGKTFLGLGFAQAFKEHPVIILAPKILESNWMKSIADYGVHGHNRFTFVSYDDAPTILVGKDLSRHIILADEVHNLIKLMRSANPRQNSAYTELYMNLRTAYRILGLTGTPVYSDESDLAYMVNLVSGKDLMPFNQEAFRLKYTSIITSRQFFRGYVLESNMFTYTFPVFLTLTMGALFPPWGFAVGFPAGVLLPVGYKWLTSLDTYKLRSLDVEGLTDIANRYISYFRFDESQFKEFPGQKFEVVEIPYNRQQYSFFLRLVEGDLEVEHLQRLLRNDKVQLSDEFVTINSSSIHENLYSSIGAGRDIGNFEFTDASGTIIEPPKFKSIYESLKKNNEQTVIYSNYYETGTLAFARFLKRQNYDQQFAIVHPDLKANQVGKIVDEYNRGDIRVLLLHPDVTEGISLKGTQYLEILEPIINNSVLEQVIGRTRRFQSHSHLPKAKQVVNVKVWQSKSAGFSADIGDIYRANWYKRYREISYMSLWGIGLMQVDKKYERKALNPEELASLKLKTLKKNLGEMQNALTKVSIESHYRIE